MGPLSDVRVIDVTDEYGAYGGRLLAGLGASVLRIGRASTEPSPPLSPIYRRGEDELSLFDEWVNAGTTPIDLDIDSDEGRTAFSQLVESADVLLDSSNGMEPGAWDDLNPRLIHVVASPFGWGRSPDMNPVDDLIVMGAGGLLHLGGYPDTGPVGAFGQQSAIASGIFAAVAAIVGLIEREKTGKGSAADVSAQEAVAQALEDSFPAFALTGEVRGPQGEDAREAGTGIYACQDGYVSMVAGRLGTARAWSSLVEWICADNPAGAELLGDEWSEFSFRQSREGNDRFRRIFEEFASKHPKAWLYREGQSRGIAVSPVSTIDDLLTDEQLAERGFLVDARFPNLDSTVTVPGPPYRFSRSDVATFPGRDDTMATAIDGTSMPVQPSRQGGRPTH